MKKTIFLVFIVIAVILTSNGCKKGDTGTQGPAGTNGTNGTNGTDGNANVHAMTVHVLNSDWAWNSTLAYSMKDISVPFLTSDIVSKGAVLGYMSTDTLSWTALPFIKFFTSGVHREFSFVSSLNNVRLTVTDYDLTEPSTPGSYYFKIICIAPSALSSHLNTNWKNYAEVKKEFNLSY